MNSSVADSTPYDGERRVEGTGLWAVPKPSGDALKQLHALAHGLRTQAREELGLDESSSEILALEELTKFICRMWQRSTSSIEGRNGYLSQRHHASHGISERKLACLTHLHNF